MNKMQLLAAIADADDDWPVFIEGGDGRVHGRVIVTLDDLGEIILGWDEDEE